MKATEQTNEAAPLTAEQAALIGQAAAVDGQVAPVVTHDENGQPIAEQQAPEDIADENRALLQMLVNMLTPALPFLPQCYTPEAVQNIAAAYTAVEEKYGWNLRDNFKSPELILAFVAVPPTVAAVSMGREYFAELRAKRAAEAERARRPKPTEEAA